jgi:hypothetical protein
LPATDQTCPEPAESLVEQRTATEDVLAGIWADALKLDKVQHARQFFLLWRPLAVGSPVDK